MILKLFKILKQQRKFKLSSLYCVLSRKKKELLINRKNKDKGSRDHVNILENMWSKNKDPMNTLVKFNGNNSEDTL